MRTNEAVYLSVNQGVGKVVGQLRAVHWAVRSTVYETGMYWVVHWAMGRAVHRAWVGTQPHPGLELYLGSVTG